MATWAPRRVLTVGATGMLALTLAACSTGGGPVAPTGTDGTPTGTSAAPGSVTSTECTNTVPHPELPTVVIWAWYPNMQLVADNFNAQHTDVQVCWLTVAGGTPAYDKYQAAISAGTGLPDIIMVEADHLPTYEIQDALVDLTQYGVNDIKDEFSEGAWKDVSSGAAVYAVPIDGGPMGLIYRKDIWDAAGITTMPTTWDEYAADAAIIKETTGAYIASMEANSPARMIAQMIQAGADPFSYDLTNRTDIRIKVNDDISKKVLKFWSDLVANGYAANDDSFTTDYVANLGSGKYATWPSAAWAPGYMSGAGIEQAAGLWRSAPLPKWSPSDPGINWGGSAFSVTSQSTQPELATKVAMELYADDASLTDGWQNQIIFPLRKSVLDSDEFLNVESAFFDGQQINKEVYVPAANAYTGMVYLPFGSYYYAQFADYMHQVADGTLSSDDALDQLQQTLVDYAKGQGFTVSEELH
jgi:multiple sugar transport system substrate-binding protein